MVALGCLTCDFNVISAYSLKAVISGLRYAETINRLSCWIIRLWPIGASFTVNNSDFFPRMVGVVVDRLTLYALCNVPADIQYIWLWIQQGEGHLKAWI